MLKIALGRSAFSNKIKTESVSVAQLFRKFKKPELRTKKDGPYFIFASFSKDIRNAQTVEQFYGATIDLDDTALSLRQIQRKFKNSQFLIHTTFSHKEKGDRYRLILPYKKPVNKQTHLIYMQHLFNLLGQENVDLSSKAISRPMYLPACPPSRKQHFKTIINRNSDPFELVITPELEWEMQERMEEENPAFNINEEIEEGDRNNALARFTGRLIGIGYDKTNILRSAQVWNETNLSPPLSNKDVKTIVESVCGTHGRNSNKWGYQEILRQIKTCANIDEDFESLIKTIATGSDINRPKKEMLIRALATKSKISLTTLKAEVKKAEGEIDEDEAEEVERSAKNLRKEFKEWVYISRDDRAFNTKTGIAYRPEGFNRKFSNILKKGALLTIILQHKCLKEADMLQFHPGEDQLFYDRGITFCNSYTAPELMPEPGSVDKMMEHFEYLIPDKFERDTLLDYMAFLIQKPGKKVMWMPIIKGGKGIGKSMIIDKVIIPLLGDMNVRAVESRKIGAAFNAWKLDTQLVVFHELKVGETRKEKVLLTEELKEVITDNFILAAKKGIDDYQTPNRLNLFGITNHEDAIMITIDERRFFMIRCDAAPKDNKYYRNIARWFRNNKAQMLNFFINRSLKRFDESRAPDNRYTMEVKANSLPWPQSIIAEALGKAKHPFVTQKYTSWNHAVDYVRSQSTGRDAMAVDDLINPGSSQSYRLTRALLDCGFRKWYNPGGNSRLKIKGRLETVYICPKKDDSYNSKQIRDVLAKQQEILDFKNEEEG